MIPGETQKFKSRQLLSTSVHGTPSRLLFPLVPSNDSIVTPYGVSYLRQVIMKTSNDEVLSDSLVK